MQILIIGIAAYWFAVLSKVPDYIKQVLFKFGVKKPLKQNWVGVIKEPVNFSGPAYTTIRLYPIDCEKCLAFWVGLIYFPFTFDGVLYSFCASFVAIVTGLIINKLR